MADNGAALATLDGWIAKIRALPEVVPAAMADLTAAVAGAVRQDLAAGRDPGTGKAWSLTKSGEQAMKGAAAALRSTFSGRRITLELGAPYVFHHVGVRGAEPRHVVPDRVTLKLGDRIRLGFMPHWKKATAG